MKIDVKGITNSNYKNNINIEHHSSNKSVVRKFIKQEKQIVNNQRQRLNSEAQNMKAIKTRFKQMALRYSHSYLNMGMVNENMRQYKMAISSYEKAFNWDPQNVAARIKVNHINTIA